MTFTHRDSSYEVPAPIRPSADAKDQPKIKLFYRGNTFDYIPRSEVVSEEETDGQTVTLFYRGNTYVRKLQPPKPYQKPRAINWRWKFE